MGLIWLFGGFACWAGIRAARFGQAVPVLRDQGPESAEELLKRRYARGEIDKNAYEGKLIDLRPRQGSMRCLY